MKKALLIVGLISLFSYYVRSQNLVLNPSFEIYTFCPEDMTMTSVRQLIPDWYLPTKGTSDYFNECAIFQVGVPQNIAGNLYAFDGKAYAGIVLLEKPPLNGSIKKKLVNYREYIQTKLKEPLKPNKKYYISLNYAIANYSTYATNSLGICLTKSQIKNRASFKILNCNPVVMVPKDSIYTERNYWYTLSDTIIANGDEEYLTIGNFYDDLNTSFELLDISDLSSTIKKRIWENRIAYYYIDFVSVVFVEEK